MYTRAEQNALAACVLLALLAVLAWAASLAARPAPACVELSTVGCADSVECVE